MNILNALKEDDAKLCYIRELVAQTDASACCNDIVQNYQDGNITEEQYIKALKSIQADNTTAWLTVNSIVFVNPLWNWMKVIDLQKIEDNFRVVNTLIKNA
jgi:hypothetical protein